MMAAYMSSRLRARGYSRPLEKKHRIAIIVRREARPAGTARWRESARRRDSLAAWRRAGRAAGRFLRCPQREHHRRCYARA